VSRHPENAGAMTLRRNLWDQRFVVLVVGLVALILVSPHADDEGVGRHAVQALFAVLVFLSIYVSSSNRTLAILVSVLVAGWLVIALSGLGGLEGELGWAAILLLMTICFLVFVIVEMAVFAAPSVDTNIVCGGIACYFLIGIFWALSFALVELAAPGSLSTGKAGAPPVLSDLMYFSLTCLTTLGFGDILPLRPFARLWSTLETAAGLVYFSVFVARLVSLYKA
jgi:hypothetical protein